MKTTEQKLIEELEEYIEYLKSMYPLTFKKDEFESKIAALKKDSDHKENKEDDNIDLSFPDYWLCCKSSINEQPKYDEKYLNECIKKAAPNLSKIKDIDKDLDEIRGEKKVVWEITDEEVLKEARRQFIEGYQYIFVSGAEFVRKWYRDQIKTK